MLLIGSAAMAHHGIKRSHTQVLKDMDMIVWPNELSLFAWAEVVKDTEKKKIFKEDGIYFELEVATAGSNQEELLTILGVPNDGSITVAPKEVLYALKMSHRHLKNSSHFYKTMVDIRIMRRAWGMNDIAPYLQDWYEKRERDTYTYSHPKLNQSKTDFFDTSVFKENPYIYDHDSLHEVVKIYEKPAYAYFVDGPVKVSKEMFFNLPRYLQLASVYEECCVLALERAIIPNDAHQDWAFNKALEKVCTSIASGWWRDFSYENHYDVMRLYHQRNDDLRVLLEIGLVYDVVKPFKEGE